MSVQQLGIKKFEEDGYFNSMLFLNLEKYNSLKKESTDSSELRLSIDLTGTPQSNPIQNCLSKDLLEQLDQSSPVKEAQNNNAEIDSLTLEDWTTDTSSFKNYSPKISRNYKPLNHSLNNKETKNKKYKKVKKSFVERDGDWTCFYCKNLNFSFRKKCNRCSALKDNSEKEHDKYMENVLMIINENERKRKSSSL